MKRLLPILLLAACASQRPDDIRFVERPDGRLHVQQGGTGAAVPVLFVHGNTGNLTQWNAQLDHLRQSRKAVAFDLRGMGLSDPSRSGDYSLDAFAGDVLAAGDAAALRRFVLVGHSFGATVAAAFAAKYPDRVAGLILVDGAGKVDVPAEQSEKVFAGIRADKNRFMDAWFAPLLANSSDDVKKAVMESVARTPAEVIIGAFQAFLPFDMLKAVASYRGPKLIIAAPAIEQPFSLHVQDPSIPAAKIAGTGHWLMLDKPEEFNRLLDGFLEQIR